MEPAFPYQIQGSSWLAADGRHGLGDEMGIGKSRQAIMAWDRIGAERGLVVAPAGAHRAGVWQGEFKRWSTRRRRIIKVRHVHDLNLWIRGKADVALLSYELATKWGPRFSHDLMDVAVIDEAHYCKTPDSQRTQQLLGVGCDGSAGVLRWAANVWPLSGTFIPNDPADLWPWLRFLGATHLNSKTFRDRYFHKRVGTYSTSHRPRPEMLGELRALIRSVILRRTASEVGLQIPPMFTNEVEIDGDSSEIMALLREHPGLDAVILDAIEQGGLSNLEAPYIATLRRLIGEAKAPAYVEMVAEDFRGGLDKLVIMGLHIDALRIIKDGLIARGFDGVTIVGGTTDKAAVEGQERFRDDPNCRWLIGNLFAAGTALTLTASNHLDLFEQWWAPAPNAQAIKRIHRLTQKRNSFIRLISLRGSLDETVTEILGRKIKAILAVEGLEAA